MAGDRIVAATMNAQRLRDRGFATGRMKTKAAAARAEERPAGRNGRSAALKGAQVINPRGWAAISRSFNLSHREEQLVRKVFDDCTDYSIASGLEISSHTVHTHFGRLYRKLRVANRAQLIVRVVDEFLAMTASPGSTLPPVCPFHAARRCPMRRRPVRA
jgi:DNA-binding CsgD family transcriptional regulator